MTSVKNLPVKNALFLFFLLVYIISWGAIYLFAGPSGFPMTEDQTMLMGMAILLGPTLASLILTATISPRSGFRDLFSRLLKWRVRVHWYAVALLIAPLATGVILGLFSLFSSEFQPAILLSPDKFNLIVSGIIGGLIVGLFEELGWTGFAVPRFLKTQGILCTGVIIGVLWGAWHFPLFWEVNSFTASLPFILLVARLFSWLPPYRALMVWMYKNTESLFVTILMHTSLVATLIVMDPMVKGANLVFYILARAALLWAMVVVMFVRGRKKA